MTEALDPRYTPEEHRAAYQGRLRDLRRQGIPLPPGASIDEEPERSIYDLDPDADADAAKDAFDRELAEIEVADQEAQRRLLQ